MLISGKLLFCDITVTGEHVFNFSRVIRLLSAAYLTRRGSRCYREQIWAWMRLEDQEFSLDSGMWCCTRSRNSFTS